MNTLAGHLKKGIRFPRCNTLRCQWSEIIRPYIMMQYQALPAQMAAGPQAEEIPDSALRPVSSRYFRRECRIFRFSIRQRCCQNNASTSSRIEQQDLDNQIFFGTNSGCQMSKTPAGLIQPMPGSDRQHSRLFDNYFKFITYQFHGCPPCPARTESICIAGGDIATPASRERASNTAGVNVQVRTATSLTGACPLPNTARPI